MPTRNRARSTRRASGARHRPLITALLVVAAVVVVGGGAFVAVSGLLTNRSPLSKPVTPRCVASTDAGTAALDAEQSANAALIAAVGQARDMSPRAVTIALATAMQESKLRNLNYGDRDSLGLFQQRPSQDWGTAEQIMDPLYSAGEFYRELAKVPDFESIPITEAAQAVQRSAFPDAYAQHESAARSFASSLTGNSPAGLSCTFRPADSAQSPEALVSVFRSEWGDTAADQATFTAADAADPARPATVTLRGDSDTRAWAYAQWAVAKAEQLGVESVEVAGRLWTRTAGDWQAAPSPSGEDAGTQNGVMVQLA
jgi:hypothetical protein